MPNKKQKKIMKAWIIRTFNKGKTGAIFCTFYLEKKEAEKAKLDYGILWNEKMELIPVEIKIISPKK